MNFIVGDPLYIYQQTKLMGKKILIVNLCPLYKECVEDNVIVSRFGECSMNEP